MEKYYHGTFQTDAKITEIVPAGFYEKINEKTGCPEPIYSSGNYIGFKTSSLPESSFSKEIAGAVLGKGRWCDLGKKCNNRYFFYLQKTRFRYF